MVPVFFMRMSQAASAPGSTDTSVGVTSLEFSAHQGATAALARFHSRLSSGSVHGTATSSPATLASNRSFTSASPQLKTQRAAPQCEASSER